MNPARLEMVSNVTNKALFCSDVCNIVPNKFQRPVIPPSVIEAVSDVKINSLLNARYLISGLSFNAQRVIERVPEMGYLVGVNPKTQAEEGVPI